MRRTIGVWACVLAAAAVCGFAGCRTVQGFTTKPQVQSVTVVVDSFDLRTITLRFDVELLNPGDGEMNVAGYEYELQIEGRSFTAGTSRNGFVLAPRGTARVSVPVTLAPADLQRTLSTLKNRREVSYRLAVTLLINTPLGVVQFPLTKNGCVSMFPPSAHSCREQG